jgi:hypothetical protein
MIPQPVKSELLAEQCVDERAGKPGDEEKPRVVDQHANASGFRND